MKMQGYPEYGHKRESYVIVEEEKIVEENCVYDNSSSMQMMRPNQCIPTPPHNHHAPPYHGRYYEGKHGKEGYWPNDEQRHHHNDSWNMDKPSYEYKRHDGDYKYDNMHHINMGGGANGGHHHAPPHMPPVVLNGLVKHHGDACDGVRRPMYYEDEKDVYSWNSRRIDD